MTANRRILKYFWILLYFYNNFVREIIANEGETKVEDTLICRPCGYDTAYANFIIEKHSHKTIAYANETLFNKEVLVQLIENPVGLKFEVVTLKKANCAAIGVWSTSFSWYPNYSWKICLCPKCASHIGWMFEPTSSATEKQIYPSDDGFYMIILDKIISESELTSLLISGY